MAALAPGELIAWCRRTWRDSNRGIKDVIISSLPQGVGVVVGLLTSILIARGLGPTGLGRLALALSLSALTGSLSDLGIGQTAIRYASRESAKGNPDGQMAVLRWAFRIRLAMVGLVVSLFFLLAPLLARYLWHDPQLTPLLRLGLCSGIFSALSSVPSVYFISIKRFKMNATVVIGQRLAFMAGIGWLAWSGLWTETRVLTVTLATAAVGAAVFLALVPKRALWRTADLGEPGWWRRLLANPLPPEADSSPADSLSSFAAYNLVSTIMVILMIQTDVWLIGYFLDRKQLGLYSVASRFTLPLTILLGALNTVLWPRASACVDLQQTRALTRRIFGISLAVSAVCLVYALAAPLLAPLLFGHAFAGSTLLGQMLCVRYCIAILCCPIGIIGYNFGMVRVYWLINLCQLVIVVTINCLFLPLIGPLASAAALITNDLVGLAAVGFFIRRGLAAGPGATPGEART